MQSREWLAAWFAERVPDVRLAAEDNYFEKEAIDSFGIIELIEAIEDQFAVRFAEQDYQDRRFPTLCGLAEIIDDKLKHAAG